MPEASVSKKPRPWIEIRSATTPVATASRTAMVPAMAPDTNPSARRTPKAAAVAITAIVDGPGVPITATASKTSVNDDCQGEENRCPVIAIPLERNGDDRAPVFLALAVVIDAGIGSRGEE